MELPRSLNTGDTLSAELFNTLLTAIWELKDSQHTCTGCKKSHRDEILRDLEDLAA